MLTQDEHRTASRKNPAGRISKAAPLENIKRLPYERQ
jgi:hypothetical protein